MSDAIQPSPEILPPPMPAPVLGYAQPRGFVPGGQWQEGNRLVIHKESQFLSCCVKCGSTENLKEWRKKYYWCTPWLYFLLLVNVLVCAIVMMCVRKSVVVRLQLCPTHRARRLRDLLLAWLLSLLCVATLVGSFVWVANARPGQAYLSLFGFGAFVFLLTGACIVGYGMAPVLVPKKIDNQFAWFSRAGAEYLNQLPQLAPAPATGGFEVIQTAPGAAVR